MEFSALLSVEARERRSSLKKAAPEDAGLSDTSPNPLLPQTLFLDAMVDALSLQDRTLRTGGLHSLESHRGGTEEAYLDFSLQFGRKRRECRMVLLRIANLGTEQMAPILWLAILVSLCRVVVK